MATYGHEGGSWMNDDQKGEMRARAMRTGAEMIADERTRQVSQDGWTPEHDDGHGDGQLARQAAALVTEKHWIDPRDHDSLDEWGLAYKHQNNRIRQLIISGALIAAEIDRLKRLIDAGHK